MTSKCLCCHLCFICREDHPQSLINSMSSIIISILEEKLEAAPDPLEHTSQSLFDVILHNIVREKKVDVKRLQISFVTLGVYNFLYFKLILYFASMHINCACNVNCLLSIQ